MIGKGKKLKDLYVLNTDSLGNGSKIDHLRSCLTASSICIDIVTTHVWHNRLGHLSSQRLDVLKDQLHLDSSKCTSTDPCYVCPLAKQRRLPFISHNYLS